MNDISFSPDSRRLFDLRGQFCNVWEPNALLRLDDAETEDRNNELRRKFSSLPTAPVSEAVAGIRNQITAIAIHSLGNYHAAGNDSGAVSIFNNLKAVAPVEIFKSTGMLTVEHLDWGEDGQHLACAELGGKITVKLVSPQVSDDKWTVKHIFDIKIEVEAGGIQQIMLNTDSTALLIGNRSSATLLSLNGKFDPVRRLLPPHTPARWIKHPSDPTLFLAFSVDLVRVHRWHNLMEIAGLKITHAGMKRQHTEPRSSLIRAGRSDDSVADENEQNVKINRLIATRTGSHIVFQYTISSRADGKHHQTLIFDIYAFQNGNSNDDEVTSSSGIANGVIKPIFLPENVESRIEIPLGVLSKKRFIFLDKDHVMCSLRLDARGAGTVEKAMQEHFFLPRDWLNSDCLELCTLLANGTFLIPRNGRLPSLKVGLC